MKLKDDVVEIHNKIKELYTIVKKCEETLNTLNFDIKKVDTKVINDGFKVEAAIADVDGIRDRIAQLESSVGDLRTSIKDVEENNYILLHAVDDLERTSKLVCKHLQVKDDSIRCQYCRMEFNAQSQLKDHVKKIHHTTLD